MGSVDQGTTLLRRRPSGSEGRPPAGADLLRAGAKISRSMGFPEETAGAIRNLDEHWNGAGHPDGLKGEEIPLLARICDMAQMIEE